MPVWWSISSIRIPSASLSSLVQHRTDHDVGSRHAASFALTSSYERTGSSVSSSSSRTEEPARPGEKPSRKPKSTHLVSKLPSTTMLGPCDGGERPAGLAMEVTLRGIMPEPVQSPRCPHPDLPYSRTSASWRHLQQPNEHSSLSSRTSVNVNRHFWAGSILRAILRGMMRSAS